MIASTPAGTSNVRVCTVFDAVAGAFPEALKRGVIRAILAHPYGMPSVRVLALLLLAACAGTKPSPDRSPAEAAAEDLQCTPTGNPCGENMLPCCKGLVCRKPEGGWNNSQLCE